MELRRVAATLSGARRVGAVAHRAAHLALSVVRGAAPHRGRCDRIGRLRACRVRTRDRRGAARGGVARHRVIF